MTKAVRDRMRIERRTRATGWWCGVVLMMLAVLAGCGPKADPEAETNCSSCSPGTSSFVCVLDIANQLADQEKVVCSAPELELREVACTEACAAYSASHVDARLNFSLGGPYSCHDDPTGGTQGGGQGGAVPGEEGADSTGEPAAPKSGGGGT